jgi:tRNA (mo5U34)-methyltransferase
MKAALESTNGALHREIARLGPWFHNLRLPGGVQTAPQHPLGDFPLVKWRQIEPYIARDLAGWRVLDIGCNAGFYSFELARRGALVTAVDIDPHYLDQARWAARQFGLHDSIEFCRMSVYDFGRGGERFDLVWFLGVLYHLRHPLLALDVIRSITGRQMLLQTMTMPGETVCDPPPDVHLDHREILLRQGWPRMAFVEKCLAGDPTNWWAPNHACVEAMVRSAGFRVIARPGHEIYLCEPDPHETELSSGLRHSELEAVFPDRAGANADPGGFS